MAAEPAACPTLTRGHYAYDFGDTAGMTPLMPMHTLGHDFVPPAIHAGGLRYHGMAPLVSHAREQGLIEAVAYPADRVLRGGVAVRPHRGHHPGARALARASAAVVEESARARGGGPEQVILFNLCGHGHFDMAAYDAYLAGQLEDRQLAQEELDRALAAIANFPPAPAVV